MDRRLETFLAVCQTMNYRRAAEALHLTQPAVTKQIQSLEASYGVRLFSYDGRKLRKTAPAARWRSSPSRSAIRSRSWSVRCTRLRAKFSASARQRPSATISSRPPSAALSARRSTSCSSPWTTRRACSGSSRRGSWILWSWRAFSTSAAMTASCCGRSRISASARPDTALPGGASRRRSC